jgi:hypothetical protein
VSECACVCVCTTEVIASFDSVLSHMLKKQDKNKNKYKFTANVSIDLSNMGDAVSVS